MSQRSRAVTRWLVLLSMLMMPWFATAAPSDAATLARTPPMGWNSWNHFGPDVTDADIRHAADAMVSSGMAKAGYQYVIIDDGWQGERDAQGVLHPNKKFPDMKALADYVHSKGLKFGIYSSPGEQTCGGFTGSYGHEAQDAKLFASWGVDYLKYDLCSFHKHMEGKSEAEQTAMMKSAYRLMHQSLAATGRPIVYALCSYGWGRVWSWGAEVGANLWRSTDDIQANYDSMMFNANAQLGLQRFAGPGHWNDADMLEIGNKGMDTQATERTHMSLWALLAAPLIAGNDLFTMDATTRDVLTNPEVLAVNQDALGKAGRRVMQEGPIQLWMRPLADGTMAVGLFNTLNHDLSATVDFKALGLHGEVTARDLWAQRDLGEIDDKHVFSVPSLGVVMLKLGKSSTP
ncbi:glycoside hydrolase family 27 protein [Dyella sp. 2HG41-7]|uniref:glycoside hydrolase family 27 protein n=1 Tax=Dyella sp. 2HG41-7 TaxID=2883239 RepID=UPI001F3217C4|nr:glycoside hydrolase family 27 protein [Dyella sp. 2HG41-7]